MYFFLIEKLHLFILVFFLFFLKKTCFFRGIFLNKKIMIIVNESCNKKNKRIMKQSFLPFILLNLRIRNMRNYIKNNKIYIIFILNIKE